jgi:hypothetical protein
MRYMIILAALVIVAIAAQAQTNNAPIIEDATALTAILVNQDPDPGIAGDVVEVRIGFQNAGESDAANVVAELAPQYPFSVAPGESTQQLIGTVQGLQGTNDASGLRIVKYRILVDKDAKAGTYTLKIRYSSLGSAVAETELPISVKTRSSAEVIHIDKTTLVPGQEESLSFMINNVGNSPLRDLTFYWENGDGVILPVGSDNTRYIKYIDIGGSEEIDYRVIADSNAAAGLYKLDLHLTYEDAFNRSQRTISTIAGVYVGGATDFDIAYSDSSGAQTSFTISNIGSNPANSVSVIMPQQPGWTITGSNTMIIGNLNKGDYTVASFNLQASNRTGQARNATNPRANLTNDRNALTVEITYTDTMGRRQTVDKQVQMAQTSSSAASGATNAFQSRRNQSWFSKYGWYAIALVVVLAAAGGYWWFRKPKRR